jgi:hypothetical protein
VIYGVKKGGGVGRGCGHGKGRSSGGGNGSGEKFISLDSEVESAGNNEICSMEEGQIYDFDERNLSDQNVSCDIKASRDSIVEEYDNFRVTCGSKQAIRGSSCKLSEDDSMDAALIAHNGVGVSLGKACEVHVLRREVGEEGKFPVKPLVVVEPISYN